MTCRYRMLAILLGLLMIATVLNLALAWGAAVAYAHDRWDFNQPVGRTTSAFHARGFCMVWTMQGRRGGAGMEVDIQMASRGLDRAVNRTTSTRPRSRTGGPSVRWATDAVRKAVGNHPEVGSARAQGFGWPLPAMVWVELDIWASPSTDHFTTDIPPALAPASAPAATAVFMPQPAPPIPEITPHWVMMDPPPDPSVPLNQLTPMTTATTQPAVVRGGALLPPQPRPPRPSILPIHIAWREFLLNTGLFYIIFLALYLVPKRWRRRRRRTGYCCEGCGYPRGQSPRCTECGVLLPT